MEKSSDFEEIKFCTDKTDIKSCFSSENLNFLLYKYKKGEMMTSPHKKLNEILFAAQGTVRIYGIKSTGDLFPVNQQKAPIILGDIEFSQKGNPPFYTEAVTDVICLALPLEPYENTLHSDVKFLNTLLKSYGEKLRLFAFVDAASDTIEERVMLYLKNISPEGEINGIEGAVLKLRCSRRQLQRVLKKLCEKGSLEKIGKGRYRLSSKKKNYPYDE